MQHRGNHGPRKRPIWTVIVPSRRSLPDDEGRTRHVPAQAHNFRDKQRAKSLASNIKGARVSKSGGFWTTRRVLILVGLVALAVCILRARGH
jgi:hypothetical protein